jgi:hypothetical protein
MLTRDTAVDLDTFLRESWSGAGEPAASRAAEGSSLAIEGWQHGDAASWNASQHIGLASLIPAPCLDARSDSSRHDESRACWTCAAPPPNLDLTGEPSRFSHRFDEDGTRALIGF